MRRPDSALILLAIVVFGLGCGGRAEYQLGVTSASSFAEPVPIRVADVRVGMTGDTGLGPDDRPMVVLRIDPEHRQRVREDSEFVVRRERLGTGPLFVEMIPGDGAPVDPGHHFVARQADLAGSAQEWWDDLMDKTRGTNVSAEVESLRARMDALVAAGEERWDAERPELEEQARAVLQAVEMRSDEAAQDLRLWWADAVERAEKAVEGKKAN